MLTTLAVAGYRSLRDLVVPLARLNVVTGGNGSGKSSLYRALRLLGEVAQGRAIAALAREGGIASTLWAGPETFARAVRRGEFPVQGTTTRKTPVHLRVGFAGDEYGYAIDLGLPTPTRSVFTLDPEIKCEAVWNGPLLRPAALLTERRGGMVRTRSADPTWSVVETKLSAFDSMVTHCSDPRTTPELVRLRERMRAWRFYDALRSDADAPARQPQIGTRTPALAHDGADLAAAVQTIFEIGDGEALARAVDDAFPGALIEVHAADGRFELTMRQPGLLRPLRAAELSDGTLRHLLWIAALLSPRPPELMVLNEPETSLHPDLLPALGRLIAAAATHTQVVVVSHAPRLVAALEDDPDCAAIVLEKSLGETRIAGVGEWDAPAWRWPSR